QVVLVRLGGDFGRLGLRPALPRPPATAARAALAPLPLGRWSFLRGRLFLGNSFVLWRLRGRGRLRWRRTPRASAAATPRSAAVRRLGLRLGRFNCGRFRNGLCLRTALGWRFREALGCRFREALGDRGCLDDLLLPVRLFLDRGLPPP